MPTPNAANPWGHLIPWAVVALSSISGPVWRTGPVEIESAVTKAVEPLRDDLREVRKELRDLDKRTSRLEASKK